MKTIKGLAALLLCVALSGCETTSSQPKTSDAKTADYYADLGIGYLQKERLDLANENLQKALVKNPRSSKAHHYYALLQDRLGYNEQARVHFRKALERDGRNPELLNNYGSHLCKTGAYAEAVKAFSVAFSNPLYPTPEFAYTNAGVCLQKQGDYVQAEHHYRLALERNPKFALALYRMAEIEHMRGENAKAQAFLYRYNEQGSDTPETLWLCTKINRALNDTDQAEKCATTLLARFPKSNEAASLNQGS
ncbi:type IV pilus biogenesis/stability protein PilW [Thiolinea disciformis]|uniref:type IV pilus biogenesis/stability protein PilW n=1 Tax=Thiolinea disciformis TaxID=125614 RepID=UPI000361367D|nr:type IV pilus biogenesis/stability protein PilW [Thiolinea disciformis]